MAGGFEQNFVTVKKLKYSKILPVSNFYFFVLKQIPKGHEDISTWEYLAIPSGELEDKNMPGYCVGSVPAAVRKKYTGRAKEVLIALNNAK